MRKYRHVLGIGIQNNLTYRFNFLARSVFGLIPLIAVLYVWRTIYAGKGGSAEVSGYSFAGMVTYYLMTTVVDAFTAVNEDDWQIAADIRDGNISQFLLKPLDYLGYRFSLFISGRLTYLAVAAVPLAIFILCLHRYFVLPSSAGQCLLFAASVILTALLQFFMSYTMALLAFWVLEVSTLIFILFAFEYIASGHLFPLDVLPPALARAMYFTPFPYQLFFPVSLYMGRLSPAEITFGFLMQAGWVFASFVLARFVWSRGIRKYAAAGG